jgi:hypothetical protein
MGMTDFESAQAFALPASKSEVLEAGHRSVADAR